MLRLREFVLCCVNTVITLVECSGDCAWCGFHRGLECLLGQSYGGSLPYPGKARVEVRAMGNLHPSFRAKPFVLCCVHDGESSFHGASLPGWLQWGWETQGRAGQERGHPWLSHWQDRGALA